MKPGPPSCADLGLAILAAPPAHATSGDGDLPFSHVVVAGVVSAVAAGLLLATLNLSPHRKK